jgi:hypothetical protein
MVLSTIFNRIGGVMVSVLSRVWEIVGSKSAIKIRIDKTNYYGLGLWC